MAHVKIRFPTQALWLLQESGGEGGQCIPFVSVILHIWLASVWSCSRCLLGTVLSAHVVAQGL